MIPHADELLCAFCIGPMNVPASHVRILPPSGAEVLLSPAGQETVEAAETAVQDGGRLFVNGRECGLFAVTLYHGTATCYPHMYEAAQEVTGRNMVWG